MHAFSIKQVNADKHIDEIEITK